MIISSSFNGRSLEQVVDFVVDASEIWVLVTTLFQQFTKL
jgi:hypothetical protein